MFKIKKNLNLSKIMKISKLIIILKDSEKDLKKIKKYNQQKLCRNSFCIKLK